MTVTARDRYSRVVITPRSLQVAVYPLEICKTRLAVSSAGTYAGITDCVRQVVRHEGPAALFQARRVTRGVSRHVTACNRRVSRHVTACNRMQPQGLSTCNRM